MDYVYTIIAYWECVLLMPYILPINQFLLPGDSLANTDPQENIRLLCPHPYTLFNSRGGNWYWHHHMLALVIEWNSQTDFI